MATALIIIGVFICAAIVGLAIEAMVDFMYIQHGGNYKDE